MTMDAVQHVFSRFVGQEGMNKLSMTMQASLLSHSSIARFNLNRFRKISSCKGQRMKETIVRLGNPLSQKVVGQVAIIASRDGVMAGILPGIKMRLHDMAIRTGLGVVGKIGHSTAIIERE
jgi:hypothetical protein